MQFRKHYPILIAMSCLLLTACDTKKDQIYQVVRCVMATETVAGGAPGEVGIKTGQAVAQYQKDHGLDMNYEEIKDLAEKARIEITGNPELPMPAQIEREKKIMASDQCKNSHP